MAQQGAGDPSWPLNYDNGSGYSLPPAADDIDNYLDLNSLAQHSLETWPPEDAASSIPGFNDAPQHDVQFALTTHQQLAPEYAGLVGAGHLPAPNDTAAAAQQGWSSFQIPPHSNGQSPVPGFSIASHDTGSGYDPSQQGHKFVGHAVSAPYGGGHDFPAPDNALGNSAEFLPGQIRDGQWHQQQHRQRQQPASQHNDYLFTEPEVQALTSSAIRPSASPAPRLSTGTPDVNSQHTHPQANAGYQSPAPSNWPGQTGGHGTPLGPVPRLQQQHQQQQSNFQQQQPQAQPMQMGQQPLAVQQPQSQASPSPAPPSTGTTIATKIKAPKVTKPKAGKVTKAKQAPQALQASHQVSSPQQAQPGQPYQQPIYLDQQQAPPQYQHIQNVPSEAGTNAWQQQQAQPGNSNARLQYAENAPIQNQQGFPPGHADHGAAPQIWPDQKQQFVQPQIQQSPPQYAQQLHGQQSQPPYQQQPQKNQQPEQQSHLQQLHQQQQQHHQQQFNVQQQPRAFNPPSSVTSKIQQPGSDASVTPTVRAKSTKAFVRKAPLTDVPPTNFPHLVSAADTLERQQFFPGVPFLALGNLVQIEPPLTTTEPAVQPDPAKELGKRHFPGRKNSLPCEIIAEYDRLVSNQPPEKKEALILELRGKLKGQGKILPPKVYKFASFGDLSKKTAKTASRSSAAMESPNSDDDDDEEEEEEVRSATRPTNPADAAAWDAIGIVHVTDNGPTTIKRAVKSFGDFIKGIYDSIKETKEKVKKAEESASTKKDALEQLKKALAAKQEVLFRAVDAADEKGHEQVLENLGGNGPLVANLVSALRDCVNAADFNGKLPKALLRFMSQFTTVTDEMLNQRLKFDKIQKRFMTKGDDEVKGLVGEIVSKTVHAKQAAAAAAASPLSSQSQGTDSGSGNGTSRVTKLVSRVPSESLSSKRPREDESDSRSAKKIAGHSASGAPQAVNKPGSSQTPAASGSSIGSTPAKPWAGTALLPGKSRPAVKPLSATKSDSSAMARTDSKDKASSAGSTAKRDSAPADTPSSGATSSSTTVASAAAASRAKKAAAAKAELMAAASSGSISSSSKLGALLDEIAKPKSGITKASTPDSSSESASSSETSEEKVKRLRKESRRKLRVTWKSGDELTQVRVFTKDVGEDEGRANYLLRDAGDDRSEGLALKRSLKKGAASLDDDEDDGGDAMAIDGSSQDDDDNDLPYRPWFEPSAVDFSTGLQVAADKKAKIFATRGGDLAVDTAEQKTMADRENTVLMAVYTDPSDIPPTPKSPVLHAQNTDEAADGAANGVSLLPAADAKLQELQTRWNEERTLGVDWALWNALKRLEATRQQQQAQTQADADDYDPAAPATLAVPVSKPVSALSSAMKAGEITSFTGRRGGEVVRLLSSSAVKNWKATADFHKLQSQAGGQHHWQDYTDPAVQKAVQVLEAIVQQLRSKPFPATEPPEYITDAERIREWWTGYNREKQREKAQADAVGRASQPPTAAAPAQAGQQQQDAAAAWAAYYAQFALQQQQQQQTAQPADAYAQYLNAYYQQQQQQVQGGNGASGDTDAQLQALLANLGGGGSSQATTAALPQNDAQIQAFLASMTTGGAGQNGSATAGGDPNQAFMLSLAQWASGQPQQQQGIDNHQANSASSGGNTNQQEANRSGHSAHNAQHRNKRDRDRSNDESSVPSHLRGINRALIGTKACVFWASGKCAKGDKCTFRHD